MSATGGDYREVAPPGPLAASLVCTWAQTVGAPAQRVLPDGCADILWIGEAPPLVVGPATRATLATLPPGTIVAGARFRPGRITAWLPLAADELTDRLIPLADLWRGDADAVTARVLAARTPGARRAAIEAALLDRVPRVAAPDPQVAAAVGWLARQPRGRVADLPSLTGLGERQLRRRFQVAVGYEPKRLARILRLQRLLALAGRQPPGRGRLAALALAAGYADQAHMARECAALAGLAPGALLPGAASALALTDFFKTV
jgi:AraC-like DNA-binding protein